MSSKRKRKEQARLNEQTQFTLNWPILSPKDSSTILTALTALGKFHLASTANTSPPICLTVGTNAVARSLRCSKRRKITTTTTTPTTTTPTVTAPKKVKEPPRTVLVFIARHAHQLFVRHLPFLAAQSARVKCCGLPVSSSTLGHLFGLKSAAVISVTVPANSSKPAAAAAVPPVVRTLLECVQEQHVLTNDHFVNLHVPLPPPR